MHSSNYNSAIGSFKKQKVNPQVMSKEMLLKLNESSASNVTPMQSEIDMSTSHLQLPTSPRDKALETVLSDFVG